MKKITYIWLICALVFACTSPDDGLPTADEDDDNGPQWFDGLELPLADHTGYPYDRSKITTATVSINTANKIAANNLLLGANFGGFTSDDEKAIIRYLNPVTVRFPSGVWSNWYNWEIDRPEYDKTDSYNTKLAPLYIYAMDVWERGNIKTGFPGLKTLHDELNFNTLFTYNINYDTPAKSVARLQDSEAKGFDVKYIELGNEQFWEDQRSGKISTPIKYYLAASAISRALKAEKPSVKLSVPYGWRDNQAAYNAQVGLQKTYFDAISLHKYIDPEKSTDAVVKSKEAYKTILTSRLSLKQSAEFVSAFAPGKPIWLTEWGVSCGLNAASFLGQADAYLYLFENQNIYERAEWYGATTKLNPMYEYDGNPVPGSPLTNLKKTGHGMVYEILRDVFENSQMFETSISTRILATGVNSVEARAVTKNGKTQILVVNKTVRSVPFRVKIDDKFYEGAHKHEALSFKSLQENKSINANESPLTLIEEGTKVIVLPPYSINKITL